MQNWYLWAIAGVILYLAFKPGVPADANLSPAEFKVAMEKEAGVQLIDVRTTQEYSATRLAGAKNIPVGELKDRLKELDVNKPVIVYCRSGNRSGTAVGILKSHGFAKARHLEGGISAWEAAGLPTTR